MGTLTWVTVGAIGAFLFFVYAYDSNQTVEEASQTIFKNVEELYDEKISKGKYGDTISHLIPLTPEGEPEQRQVVPANHTIDDIAASKFTENGTAIEDLEGPKSYVTDPDILQFELGQIVPLSGYINLHHADGRLVDPHNYNYLLEIDCSSSFIIDGFMYCNISPRPYTRYKQTEDGGLDKDGNSLGGLWTHRWTPQNNIQPGIYDVRISASSVAMDGFGQTAKTVHHFQFELYEVGK